MIFELKIIDVLISVAVNCFHCEKHDSLYIPATFEHYALDCGVTRRAAEQVELEDFLEAPIGDLYTVYLNVAGAAYCDAYVSAWFATWERHKFDSRMEAYFEDVSPDRDAPPDLSLQDGVTPGDIERIMLSSKLSIGASVEQPAELLSVDFAIFSVLHAACEAVQ